MAKNHTITIAIYNCIYIHIIHMYMLYSGNSEIFSQLVLPVWRFQRNILINKLTFDLP